MKKIFTLAFSIMMCSTIFAAAEFFVRINANGNYTVSLNNQTITSNTSNFRFFDLYAGNYNLKVIKNGNGRVVFNQNISIQDGFRTVAELDAYTGLKIIDKLAFVQKSWYIDNIITTAPICVTPIVTEPAPRPNPYNNGWNNNGNNYPSYPNNYPYNGGNYGYNGGNLVDENSLQSIKQAMKNASFETKMIQVGQTALKDRVLKTEQVHQLLDLFNFESNKLEFAKFCYDKTIDKNNYYTLYDDFAFNSYSSQLDKYINSK